MAKSLNGAVEWRSVKRGNDQMMEWSVGMEEWWSGAKGKKQKRSDGIEEQRIGKKVKW